MSDVKLFGTATYDPNKKGVDKHGAKRTVPMEVLALGMPRTGTASIREALKQLGYHDVYHMASCLENIPDSDIWMDAIHGKWGGGKPFGRADFDQVLGNCMAVTDWPCGAFSLELIEAYPEAKVVMTIRDPDRWFKSIMSTIGKAFQSLPIKMIPHLDPWVLGRWVTMAGSLWHHAFGSLHPKEEDMIAIFNKQYADIRRVVPKDRLLEFRPADGWEPLCKFLGKEIPPQPYPRVNESANFEASMSMVINSRLKVLAKEIAKVAVPLGLAAAALYFVRRR